MRANKKEVDDRLGGVEDKIHLTERNPPGAQASSGKKNDVSFLGDRAAIQTQSGHDK